MDETNELVALPWTAEAGETGLRGALPREGWIYQEFLAKLRGRAGLRVYREMSENDPIIGAVLQAYEMLLKSVQWIWTPADDSNEARAVKEAFEFMFNRGAETPWGDVLEESLQMLPYGFMLMEIVLQRVTDEHGTDMIGLKKLAPRSPDTVWRWIFDPKGNLLGVEQQLQIGHTVKIPMEKMLHFRTVSKLGNPEGRSILRNAYTSYVKKLIIEDAEGKTATRAAGLVVVRIPKRFMDPNADDDEKKVRAAWERAAAALGRDRQAHMLMSSSVDAGGKYEYDVEYKTAGSTTVMDHGPVIDRHDRRMSMSMLADFLMLGHEKIGSFALSQNKTDFFSTAVGAVADNIAEPVNRGLVPKLMRLNQWDPALTPRLEHSDLRMTDPEVMSAVAGALAGAGVEGLFTPEVIATIFKAAKLPVPKQVSDVG